jgi:CheY-like chemotaxis protein
LTPRRALVVDDDLAIRILVTRILSREGFTVDSACDGAEAIEKMLENDYAMITLDLMMPRLDGEGVVKFLVEHHPEELRKIVVMTAFGTGARDRVCPPVKRFLDKPFEVNALLAQAREFDEEG